MTWKGIRDTLLWMVLLLLIGVIAAGGLAARYWAAKDDLLTDVLRGHLAKTFPDCNVAFDSARCIDLSHFEITHFVLTARQTGADLLQIPRVVVEIDTDILRLNQRLVIRELIAHSPEVHCVRDLNNHWNWEGVSVRPPVSAVSPEWTIKNAALRIGFACAIDGQTRFVNCQGIQATFRPESHQRYEFEGIGVAEAFGSLKLSGLLDSGTGEWQLHGSAGDVRLGDSLLELAARFSPKVEEQLTVLRATNQALQAKALTQQPQRTASTSNIAGSTGPTSLLRADMAIQFEVGQSSPQAALDYQVSGHLSHGQISELLLPLPLYDLEAKFHLTPESMEIRDLKAANSGSTLYVNGSATRVSGEWAKNFLVRATQLKLDERIRSFLWGQPAQIFDLLSPSGTFDVHVGLTQRPGERLKWAIEKFEALDCRAVCDYFRYPVEHVRGEVTQQGSVFLIDLEGQAGGRPVMLKGAVDPPTKAIDFHIDVTDFPVDHALRSALQRPDQEKIRKVLESLRLDGVAKSGHVRVVRNEETEGRVLICIEGELANGTMNYTGFPYELTDLRGKLTFNPLKRNTWIFDDLEARHGTAQMTGRGLFDLEDGPGLLMLEMAALQAPLDHDLEKATITASPELETAWTDFGIKGAVDVDRMSLSWTPGAKCRVILDGIHWTNGQFCPKAFPYAWHNVSGTLQWDGERLRIHSLHGDHNGAYVLINGAVTDSAYLHVAPTDEIAWRLFLDEKTLHVIKLNPDDEFKRAVPAAVATALNTVDLKNPLDLSLGLDLKGWAGHGDLITAAWVAFATLKDNTLTAGAPVTNVTGNIVHRGNWDGRNLELEGYGELESLRTLQLNFRKIQGPFLMKANRLTMGTPKLSGKEPVYSGTNPYRQEQIRASLYGGQVGIDVDVNLNGDPKNLPYQTEVNVTDVELGEWAREHNFQKMMGKVNGVLQASGQGSSARNTTGQGWIQVTPAALYELPVFAQMMTLLSFRPAQAGDAAFNYAYGDFTIHDEMFDFSNIELVGDSLKFGGRGTVGYAGTKAGALELDFYSKANNRIPIIGRVMSAVSDHWIRVQVFGTAGNPVARIQPRIPYLDDAFAGFMQAAESGQQQRTPPRTVRPPTARSGPTAN
ncbi:hypothetical protein [Planctomicrobium piriforme]|uniref:AsmA-like C-terminal region n=1 Tax=Planctomicrobium piriforme TaxID=1576369 RepID=A0A1I3LBX4_9PLAN|nr:hypothetical protein [Planctomicrobium piriforme]SFI82060.1 AsmA-like C-terminal region [Planctomicrobium piriforme]